jgi:HD-GYP domain-containing protein (c-di-GMP phosphodiesterase class II)
MINGNRPKESRFPRRRRALARERQKHELLEGLIAKDIGTYCHSRRVWLFSGAIGQALGRPAWEVALIMDAALLHDIAKKDWPRRLFESSDPLTAEDWEIIRRHPDDGAEILARTEELGQLAPLIVGHHRWYGGDPRGYGGPGRRGARLPLATRVISAADVIDVITSSRCYNADRIRSLDDCFDELRAVAGTQLDPKVVQAAIATRDLIAPVVAAAQEAARVAAA